MPIKKKTKSSKTATSKSSKVKSSKSKTSLRDRAKERIKESKKKGFTAMREAKKERGQSFIRDFYVPKGETKPIIFLMDDVVTKRTHSIVQTTPTGKTFYPSVLCTEDDDCPWCERAKQGDKAVRPSSKEGAILIIDVDGYTTDDKEVPFVVRPWAINTTLSSVLEHRDMRDGLLFTAFDATKLDRGISLDVVVDEDGDKQRWKDERDLIKFLRSPEGNKETAEILKKALDEHGSFYNYLEDEIIPVWWSDERIKLSDGGYSDDDEDDEDDDDDDKGSIYNFRKNRKSSKKSSSKRGSSKKSSPLSKKRNRLR